MVSMLLRPYLFDEVNVMNHLPKVAMASWRQLLVLKPILRRS